MVFSSAVFLLFFLPVAFAAERLVKPIRAKNIVLTVLSLLFYAYGEPVFALFLVFSALLHHLAGVYAKKKERYPAALLACLIVFDVATLIVFKYLGFFTELLNALPGLSLPVPQIRLPIGISFFTFQLMSYAIDGYRDTRQLSSSFGDTLLYVSFFPQLIAGPVVKYHDVAVAIRHRRTDPRNTARGMRRFVFGLSKKLLLANTMAIVADAVYALPAGDLSTPAVWLGALAYAMQIYYDFSGYSDMAIGQARMFGFHLRENFDHPYAAVGITDFWRKWHISVTDWFREYVYIPLGGNRKGRLRAELNAFVVFLLTGLWHGANLTFVVWGLYNWFFRTLETVGALPVRKSRRLRPLWWIYTFVVTLFGFVIFRAESLSQAWLFFLRAFGIGGVGHDPAAALGWLTPSFVCCLILCFLFMLPWTRLNRKLDAMPKSGVLRAASYLLAAALFLLCIVVCVTGTYDPFIYFNF